MTLHAMFMRRIKLEIKFYKRWEEALDTESVEYKTPFIGIIKMSSDVCKAVMERCVDRQYYDENCNKKYSVT